LARASALLDELERRFPGSPEARVALVSLGKLQMLSGAPAAALERFSSYLQSGGPLEEEALVGRAQALAKLGRSSEERATWQALLVRFPGSVYAAQARERLSALGAGATE
jgi:outer membrane protein assembly factor BamD (BamD/ComL family)